MLTGWQIIDELEKLAKDANYPERIQLESSEAIRLTKEGLFGATEKFPTFCQMA
jgi:hypothetical protein